MDHDPIPQRILPLPSHRPSLPQIVTCPLCHTAHASLTDAAVDAGVDWRCSRCGQQWDAGRLSAVSAYQASVRQTENAPAPVAPQAPHLRLLRTGN